MRATIVTGSFSADHHKPYGAGRHGHDWHVRAAFPADGGHKAQREQELDRFLGAVDHGFLDDHMDDPSNEGVAEWIGQALGCVWIYVWRYDRGREFGGEWRR